MMYNAVVRNVPGSYITYGKGKEVDQQISRLFLKDKDLSQIPGGWIIYFRGDRISRNAEIGKLMCTATEPIKIYKGSEEFQLFVRCLNGKIRTILARCSDTGEELKTKVAEMTGFQVDSIRLLFAGRQIEDKKFLWEYNISKEATIYLSLRLRGGGFVTQNVEAEQVAGIAKTSDIKWKSYDEGMNLYGFCNNAKCPSRRNGKSERVVFRGGYGTILLTPETAAFECPACTITSGKTEISTSFPISNFVLACGRAIIRFKKSGAGNEVKTVIMESLGPLKEYKTFNENAGKSEYDCMEITTVRPNSSFYFCAWCDLRIRDKRDEVVLECGQTFHSACAPKATVRNYRCLVCEAKHFASVYDFLEYNTGYAKA